jgi:hypothetical protein
MKSIIVGLIIMFCGILRSIAIMDEVQHELHATTSGHTDLRLLLYPLLIPLGITIITTGAGNLVYQHGQRKRKLYWTMYYKPSGKQVTYFKKKWKH